MLIMESSSFCKKALTEKDITLSPVSMAHTMTVSASADTT